MYWPECHATSRPTRSRPSSLAPKIERGFHLACDDVRPGRRRVVYGGTERLAIAEGVEAVSLVDSCVEVAVG